MKHRIAIIIRTRNEEIYIGDVLKEISAQNFDGNEVNVVVVDTESSDATPDIVRTYGARLINISKNDFSFGRALNLGIKAVLDHDIIVSISGHCIPNSSDWLMSLLEPIISGRTELCFGAHIGADFVRTSERNYFKHKFRLKEGPARAQNFNNGNSAFLLDVWRKYNFNEQLGAQEDIDFATAAEVNGYNIYFLPEAAVIHIHSDTNIALFRRLTLEWLSEVELKARSSWSMLMVFPHSTIHLAKDIFTAKKNKVLCRAFKGIIGFRGIQVLAAMNVFCKFSLNRIKRSQGEF